MKRTQAIELPEEEISQQKEWMREFAALENRPHTYCAVSYTHLSKIRFIFVSIQPDYQTVKKWLGLYILQKESSHFLLPDGLPDGIMEKTRNAAFCLCAREGGNTCLLFMLWIIR